MRQTRRWSTLNAVIHSLLYHSVARSKTHSLSHRTHSFADLVAILLFDVFGLHVLDLCLWTRGLLFGTQLEIEVARFAIVCLACSFSWCVICRLCLIRRLFMTCNYSSYALIVGCVHSLIQYLLVCVLEA